MSFLIQQTNQTTSTSTENLSTNHATAPSQAETPSVTATSTTTVRVNTPPATAKTNQTTKSEQPLPTGWEVSFTDTGRMFFIDHNTKATTWV